jgi:hypothetical protein
MLFVRILHAIFYTINIIVLGGKKVKKTYSKENEA